MSIQGSDEWRTEKLGHASASRANAIMARGKNGEKSATRENYLWELALERVTGVACESFETTPDMDRGTELEPAARRAFEADTGIIMLEVGFIKHPAIAWLGCSPDGRSVDGREGMEAKCRKPKGHGKVLLGGGLAIAQKQIDMQMLVCDFDAVWFVSYCPLFPPELRLYYERIPRDEGRIALIAAELPKFLADVDRTTLQLRGLIEERRERFAIQHEVAA